MTQTETQVFAADERELRAWLEAMRARLSPPNAETPPRLFALIDLRRVPYRDGFESRLQAASIPTVNLYDDFAGLDLANSGPHLLMLDPRQNTFDAVLGLTVEHEAASFIFCRTGLTPLAKHLRSLREVQMPDGGAALFRFQDTHVTAALWPLMGARQQGQVLGPAQAWAVRDTCGAMRTIETAPNHVSSGPIAFDKRTVAALDSALFPWTVADQVNEIDMTLLAGLGPCARLTLLRDRISYGRSLGLKQNSDLALYCALSLQLPEGFETTEPFARALRETREGRSSFGAAIDAIHADDWQSADALFEGAAR